MDLTEREINLLIKIYIGQKIRVEGIVDQSLNANEKKCVPSLLKKQLIENAMWKPLKNYLLYKTTEKGNKISSSSIQEILYKTNLAEDLHKIPLIFLKLCFFSNINFYHHECEFEFQEFYWDDGVKEFLIEKGLEHWNKLINLFKSRNICVQSYDYVSTNGGELRGLYNIIPEPEVKEFIKTKLGITEGLSKDILKKLSESRHRILKKREKIFFDEIVEDYSPKFTKIIEKDEKKIVPIHEEKKYLVFLSYSTKDEPKYGIKKIAEKLKTFNDIQDALIWQKDVEDNIIAYMNDYVGKCDVFILFCSPDALISDPIKDEWTAAVSLKKPILPVFTATEYIPPLLSTREGLEFKMFKTLEFIDQLHDLIIKKAKNITK